MTLSNTLSIAHSLFSLGFLVCMNNSISHTYYTTTKKSLVLFCLFAGLSLTVAISILVPSDNFAQSYNNRTMRGSSYYFNNRTGYYGSQSEGMPGAGYHSLGMSEQRLIYYKQQTEFYQQNLQLWKEQVKEQEKARYFQKLRKYYSQPSNPQINQANYYSPQPSYINHPSSPMSPVAALAQGNINAYLKNSGGAKSEMDPTDKANSEQGSTEKDPQTKAGQIKRDPNFGIKRRFNSLQARDGYTRQAKLDFDSETEIKLAANDKKKQEKTLNTDTNLPKKNIGMSSSLLAVIMNE